VKISTENGEYVDPLNDVKIAHSKLKTTILIFPYATIFDKVRRTSLKNYKIKNILVGFLFLERYLLTR